MYALQGSNLRRSLMVGNNARSQLGVAPLSLQHDERVKQELRAVGLARYELWSSEARYLPHIIHPDEHIGGVVFGYHEGSLTMMVATDRRIILLDKKPLFVNKDELRYEMIGGVRFTHAGIGTTVTLRSRIEDYLIVTFNKIAAERFVTFIEARSLEHLRKPVGSPVFGRRFR